jgi:hypothetical protein
MPNRGTRKRVTRVMAARVETFDLPVLAFPVCLSLLPRTSRIETFSVDTMDSFYIFQTSRDQAVASRLKHDRLPNRAARIAFPHDTTCGGSRVVCSRKVNNAFIPRTTTAQDTLRARLMGFTISISLGGCRSRAAVPER